MTRHLVFWLPTADHGDNSLNRARLFDTLIHSVYKAVRSVTGSAHRFDTNSWNADGESVTLFQSSFRKEWPFEIEEGNVSLLHRAIKFYFDFECVPIVMAFDLHEEIATVTLVIDCSDRLSLDARSLGFVELIGKALAALDQAPTLRHLNMIESSDTLFFALWEYLCGAIFPLESLDRTGEIILDARGLVLACDQSDPSSSNRFVSPFSQLKITEPLAPARISTEPGHLEPAIIGVVLPLLTCQTPNTVEYTLSALMGKRALFASCLGSRPDNIDGTATKPLTYLLVADAHNSWQLGRLIYRIHRAGGYRIAATKHFEILRIKAEALRAVERRLEDALSSAASSRAMKSQEIEDARDTALEAYQWIEQQLDIILDYGQHEALTYRVGRSRYYVRQFRRSAEAMRIERVEGFQPYNEYVEQRQGSAFEFLDTLGRRYERLQSDRSLLLRRIQVFNAQINENEISLAQWTADAALFVVLGPYYAAHVLVEIAFPWMHDDHSVRARMIWFACLVAGVALFIYRRKGRTRRSELTVLQRLYALAPKPRTLIILVLSALVVAAFYLAQAPMLEKAATTLEHKDQSD